MAKFLAIRKVNFATVACGTAGVKRADRRDKHLISDSFRGSKPDAFRQSPTSACSPGVSQDLDTKQLIPGQTVNSTPFAML